MMGAGVEFGYARAKHLNEGRSSERGWGVSPHHKWKKMENRDCFRCLLKHSKLNTFTCIFHTIFSIL